MAFGRLKGLLSAARFLGCSGSTKRPFDRFNGLEQDQDGDYFWRVITCYLALLYVIRDVGFSKHSTFPSSEGLKSWNFEPSISTNRIVPDPRMVISSRLPGANIFRFNVLEARAYISRCAVINTTSRLLFSEAL